MAATIWENIDKKTIVFKRNIETWWSNHNHAMNHDDHTKKHARKAVFIEWS